MTDSITTIDKKPAPKKSRPASGWPKVPHAIALTKPPPTVGM